MNRNNNTVSQFFNLGKLEGTANIKIKEGKLCCDMMIEKDSMPNTSVLTALLIKFAVHRCFYSEFSSHTSLAGLETTLKMKRKDGDLYLFLTTNITTRYHFLETQRIIVNSFFVVFLDVLKKVNMNLSPRVASIMPKYNNGSNEQEELSIGTVDSSDTVDLCYTPDLPLELLKSSALNENECNDFENEREDNNLENNPPGRAEYHRPISGVLSLSTLQN